MARRWLVTLWEGLGYLGLYYGVNVETALRDR